ncbi:MAG: hypothetical protein AB7G80_04820 [Dongiaceae bacterium]
MSSKVIVRPRRHTKSLDKETRGRIRHAVENAHDQFWHKTKPPQQAKGWEDLNLDLIGVTHICYSANER